MAAVLHEDLDDEPEGFRPYFSGPLYLDKEKHFFGPTERRMGITGFFRLSTWVNVYNKKKDIDANWKGDGTLLGGVFIIHKGEIAYEFREDSWGNKSNVTQIQSIIEAL